VHPNVASLNSLAETLRQATPLYIECRSILNDLDRGVEKSPGRESGALDFVLPGAAIYKKVWKVAMREFAKEYGVSDVAMGKTCRKLQIPIPGRGYWNKKAANLPVEPRPPLPKVQIP
jgi:hypothetical protein